MEADVRPKREISLCSPQPKCQKSHTETLEPTGTETSSSTRKREGNTTHLSGPESALCAAAMLFQVLGRAEEIRCPLTKQQFDLIFIFFFLPVIMRGATEVQLITLLHVYFGLKGDLSDQKACLDTDYLMFIINDYKKFIFSIRSYLRIVKIKHRCRLMMGFGNQDKSRCSLLVRSLPPIE